MSRLDTLTRKQNPMPDRSTAAKPKVRAAQMPLRGKLSESSAAKIRAKAGMLGK